MKEVEFSTQVSKNDLYHFLMRHFYTSFSGIFGVILSLGALIAFFLELGKRDTFQLLVLLVMASLFTVIQPLQMRMKAAQQIKRNEVFKQPLHYLVDKKGITVSQNGESNTIEWKEIRKVVETKKAFFVYMTVMNANVIPKEQIGKNVEEFKLLMKENLEKSVCKLH
ncbi:MAG: YcxB family protein [Acetivibrio sp.]